MATAQYTYHPYHTIGAATVLLWDPAAGGETSEGAWRHLGRAADAAVVVATEQVGKDLTIKGLTQPVARRNRSKRYSLSFRMLEDANPLTLDLLLGEGAAQASSGSELITVSEVVRLNAADWRELAHPFGIAAEPPPGVSELAVSAGGSGGGIAPGTYYYWVVPCTDDGDTGGFEGEPTAAGLVAVSSGQRVTFTFTPPEDWAPASYRVYRNSTDTLEGAYLAGSGFSGSPIVLDTHADSATYVNPDGPLVAVATYDGSGQYAPDVDYGLDHEKGLVRRRSGQGITDGGQVLVTYAYWRPASIVTSLGDAVDLERFRRVRLVQLAADDPDPARWRETGVEFTFHKVNVGINDSRWPFSEGEYSEGASVGWDCMFDAEEMCVGTARSIYGVLANYG